MSKIITGFSKFTKQDKIDWITNTFFDDPTTASNTLSQYWNSDKILQDLHDDFIENTISNFYLPYGVAPNFIINNREYVVPMVVEESSVVAAASLVAKFWSTRGGFKATILSTTKIGQVHFMFKGDFEELKNHFDATKASLITATDAITKNMHL